MSKKKLIWIIPLAIFAVVAFVFVGGQIVMRLWNWLLPPLVGWRLITFWQALGLIVLCRILFGGFGMKGGNSGPKWKRQELKRYANMTPEEREQFKVRLRARCGVDIGPDPGPAPAAGGPEGGTNS